MSEPMSPFEQRLIAELRDHVERAGLDRSAESVVGEVVSRPVTGRVRSPQFGRLATVLAGAAVVLLLVVVLPRLVPVPAGGPTPPPTVSGALPPSDPQQLTWFERVDLSEDRQTIRLQFTGGPAFDAADQCSVEYAAWTEMVEQELHAAVWESRRPFSLLPLSCPAVGFRRDIEVRLAQPFTGHLVRDLAGYVHFVSRPPDLAQVDIPAEWQLESERSGHSATGQWSQLFARVDPPPTSRRGHLALYQTFNGPADVTGDERQPPVLVNGQPATLWRSESSGELVLEWRIGAHGLALVANRFDFSAAELIALAETARLPSSPTP
ncbi:hypothetical protein BH23CHL7_BH23CHL7_00860 [soil metagenome]